MVRRTERRERRIDEAGDGKRKKREGEGEREREGANKGTVGRTGGDDGTSVAERREEKIEKKSPG